MDRAHDKQETAEDEGDREPVVRCHGADSSNLEINPSSLLVISISRIFSYRNGFLRECQAAKAEGGGIIERSTN